MGEVIIVLIFVLVLFLAIWGLGVSRLNASALGAVTAPSATRHVPAPSVHEHAIPGILISREHDMPYNLGARVGFSDVVSERKFSKRTGRVGVIRPIRINDRKSVRRPAETYPRAVPE